MKKLNSTIVFAFLTFITSIKPIPIFSVDTSKIINSPPRTGYDFKFILMKIIDIFFSISSLVLILFAIFFILRIIVFIFQIIKKPNEKPNIVKKIKKNSILFLIVGISWVLFRIFSIYLSIYYINVMPLDKLEKPVIYLYPTQSTKVNIKLVPADGFSVTYPEYLNGWNITAFPDGKLINNSDNKEYSYLYWEGKNSNVNYDLTSGFVVAGKDVANFLQEKLSLIGLTPREYNEFIVYWLPRMVNNKYNLIHFATDEEYNQKNPLTVSPTPDSVLRVFMVFKPLSKNISIKPQILSPFNRQGFTVVEWGGSEIK